MTKLSDTQAIILSRAAQNEDHMALPLPDSLRGGAAAKVVRAMIAKGFIEEVEADTRKGEPVWRETGHGHGVTLIATDAGLAAVGRVVPKARTPRAGTKQALVIAMLRQDHGATIDEIAAATSWAKHTVRGCLSGELKKRLGLIITSEVLERRGRVYRAEPE